MRKPRCLRTLPRFSCALQRCSVAVSRCHGTSG
jgi:hypothetical protein